MSDESKITVRIALQAMAVAISVAGFLATASMFVFLQLVIPRILHEADTNSRAIVREEMSDLEKLFDARFDALAAKMDSLALESNRRLDRIQNSQDE